MNKYHINEKGVPGVCTAKVKCQFGGDAQHYFSPEAAQKAYELSMATETVPTVKKKVAENSVPVPSEAGRVERYKHPQGKLVEINADGSVTAWKNGKIIPTSATAEKLRNGYGSWKLAAPGEGGERPVSDASVAAKTAARQDRQLNPTPVDPAKVDEKERVDTLVKNGYPKTSGLDPRKLPGVEDRPYERDEPRGWRNGRAVLPTGTRVNPHSNPESNEYIQGWDKHGDQSVIAIVKQSNGNRDVYRSILSGHNGVSNDILNDSFQLEHDQTSAAIGRGYWQVVGVYEPKPGGAVMGEIPNQNIPFYVYK